MVDALTVVSFRLLTIPVTTALVMRMETQICVPKWTVMQVTLIKHVVRNNINIKN